MNCSKICPITNERILLATDGSEYSQGAIREAISFAKKCSSKLYAMSVVEVITDYEAFSPQKIEEALEAGIKKHLESIKAQALQEGIECETIMAHGGEPHEVIVDEAAKRGVDIIIIGRRGTKGLKKLLMGEVAAKVIKHAPCKVIVVPRAAVIVPKNILIATDGSGHSLAAAGEAIKIAKRCGSSVIALSSIRSNDELEAAKANVNRVIEMAKKEEVPAEGLTPSGRSYNLIVETAGGRGVDLIAMGIPVKTALQKIFSGSATEQVIGKAGCAVLIVKGEESPATV
ncbi:MAG: universal stress protein [Nitrospirae bacterium]|nr:universal stress protein [Nitrospirota bacterium]